MRKVKAYQLSSYGVPLKHYGVREFDEGEWEKLMAFYKKRGIKPRWQKVPEVKPKAEKASEVKQKKENNGQNGSRT